MPNITEDFNTRLDSIQDECWARIHSVLKNDENMPVVEDERLDQLLDELRDYLRHCMRESKCFRGVA